ncbi:MAG: HpcH/HpaI aldolase family protein [Roseiarcus sp.]
MANPFKEKLRRDEVVVVLNPDHPSPSLTEFVATLGFDGVFIDCEHGMAGIERVQEMCRAARVVGVQSVVRPESDAPYLITRYLDAGAGGVMVPHIETPEAARSVVEAVRYARPKDYADKVIIAMLESVAAIDRLDDIVSVEGVDVFFIGPSDLSQSMKLAGQIHHPEVKATIKNAAARIRAAGRVPGTLVVRDNAAEYVAAGCRYLYEHANNFLATGARDFKERLHQPS